MNEAIHRWVVQSVISKGRHGPYAVATSTNIPDLGFVTFSLLSEVWMEKDHPEEGSEVVLEDFRKKRGGWRAMSARFVRPQDLVNSSAPSADQHRVRSKES